MLGVLQQMTVLIFCGALWQMVRPGGMDTAVVRNVISSLVFFLLLPALVLEVLWSAPVGLDSLRISSVASSGVVIGAALAWLFCRIIKTDKASTGALVLAAAFPNATYLGLPVLDATLGHWARGVAIQYDLFACLPLLLTFGILICKHYAPAGADTTTAAQTHGRPVLVETLKELLKVPAIWAAVLAIALNLSGTSQPFMINQVLSMMSAAVVPLMLLSLGMSLRWDMSWFMHTGVIVPVVAIQLLIMPAGAWFIAQAVGIADELLMAVVLEAAMPSMLIGLVLCDRYRLNTTLFAMVVTVSTLLSLASLPMWFNWMQRSLNIFYGA